MASEEELKSALERVITLAQNLQTEIDLLEGQIASDVDKANQTMLALGDVAQTAEEEVVETQGIIEGYVARVERLILVPDVVGDVEDTAMSAVERLQTELLQLQEATDEVLNTVADEFEVAEADVVETAEALMAFVEQGLLEATQTLLEETLQELYQTLADIPQEILDNIEEVFDTLLSDLHETAAEQIEAIEGHVVGLADDLKSQIEERGEQVFNEGVKDVGEAIITNTMNEVIDDIALTQISAQLTGMLSGYLPQLIIAKNVVGGVRRGLEILRAGV